MVNLQERFSMGREIVSVFSGITVKDFIKLVKEKNIPEDAWISFEDTELGVLGVKSLYLTDRDPETGDIDLLLGG